MVGPCHCVGVDRDGYRETLPSVHCKEFNLLIIFSEINSRIRVVLESQIRHLAGRLHSARIVSVDDVHFQNDVGSFRVFEVVRYVRIVRYPRRPFARIGIVNVFLVPRCEHCVRIHIVSRSVLILSWPKRL